VLADYDGIVDLLRGGQGVFNIVAMGSVVAELATTLDNSKLATKTA
jgi:hypothetical protein